MLVGGPEDGARVLLNRVRSGQLVWDAIVLGALLKDECCRVLVPQIPSDLIDRNALFSASRNLPSSATGWSLSDAVAVDDFRAWIRGIELLLRKIPSGRRVLCKQHTEGVCEVCGPTGHVSVSTMCWDCGGYGAIYSVYPDEGTPEPPRDLADICTLCGGKGSVAETLEVLFSSEAAISCATLALESLSSSRGEDYLASHYGSVYRIRLVVGEAAKWLSSEKDTKAVMRVLQALPGHNERLTMAISPCDLWWYDLVAIILGTVGFQAAVVSASAVVGVESCVSVICNLSRLVLGDKSGVGDV